MSDPFPFYPNSIDSFPLYGSGILSGNTIQPYFISDLYLIASGIENTIGLNPLNGYSSLTARITGIETGYFNLTNNVSPYIGFNVTQSNHGFSGLSVIYHDGNKFQKASANSSNTLGLWVVGSITDNNNFQAIQAGKLTEINHGLTSGNYYFVSNSIPGTLDINTPSGNWSNPLLFVQDQNTVHILPFRPSQNGTTVSNNYSVTTINSNYTASPADGVVLVKTTSAILVTLPTAIGNTGKFFNIKKITSDSNALTITGVSGQTIDGALTYVINTQYTNVELVSDNSNWNII